MELVMKKIIFIYIISLLNFSIFAQDLSDKKKQEILSKLTNYVNEGSLDIIYDVIDYNLPEALPIIENNIWKVKIFHRSEFLLAMIKYNSAFTKDFALRHLDSLQNKLPKDFLDTELIETSKIMTCKVLFLLKDFSKTDYIFDLIENDKYVEENLELLPLIIKSNSSESNRALDILKNIIVNNTNENIRYSAIYYYEECFGKDSLNVLIDSFLKDNSQKVKSFIINSLLRKYKSEKINSALKQAMLKENDSFLKILIARMLLNMYGSIVDYKFVKDQNTSEPDLFVKNYSNKILYRFKPIIPDSTSNIETMIDTLNSYTSNSLNYNWLRDNGYKNQLLENLQAARNHIIASDSLNCYKQIKSFQNSINQVYSDSASSYPKYVSKDAYKFLYYYPKYILERLPSPPTVKLEDSYGKLLPTGSLQYYEGGWKPAANNGDGTFYLDTKLKTISLRMTYEYGSQTKNNVTVGRDTIVFQTKNVQVKILDSKGAILDTGKVQYYAGAWREFGTTINGVVSKELLPNNYSFRITYAYASNDKQQNIGTNPIVIFQTVNTTVQLKNSLGNLIDIGTVQYYSGAWREFGTTINGVVSKELLPNNYSFRMTYAYASNDRQQNIGTNPIVIFQTVNTTVQLKNSLGNLIDVGTVQYYSGAWRSFGTTINGNVTKELLPASLTFRAIFGSKQTDKTQNIFTNNIVDIKLP
jgi:hypothetical protein